MPALFAFLLATRALAQEPVPGDPPADAPSPPDAVPLPDFSAQLEDAVASYLQGDVDTARAKLQTLLANGPELPAPVRQRALAYLGDILYSEQGPEASRSVFEALLREAPAYRMDPYAHPSAVCAWVEAVRRERFANVAPEVPRPEPAARAPFPVRAVLPGGVQLFHAGRPWAGASLALLQTTSVAVSLGTRIVIEDAFAKRDLAQTGAEDVALPEREAITRLVWVNRGAATVGWLAWGLPATVELARWSAGRKGAASLEAGPSGVALRGSFR